MAQPDPHETARRGWLNRNVLALSATSMFTDVHSHAILALLPTFMSDVLGMSKSLIGLVEGVGTAAGAATQWLSGWISDRTRHRKPFAVVGYGLSLVAKPLLAIARSFGHVLFVRLTDRLGKGIRTAPRDALIAESVPSEARGRAFGFHRASDTVGAIGGSLLAYVLLRALGGDYRMTFLWATIGGALAMVALVAFARDVPREDAEDAEEGRRPAPVLPRSFKVFMLAHSVFHLGYLSYAFLLLRAGEVGIPDLTLRLLYLGYNLVYAASALPAGRFLDVAGGRATLVVGYLLFALTCVGMALVPAPAMMWVCFALYGLHRGFVDPARSAYSSSLVARAQRGSALGLMHSLGALMSLPANLVAGFLWDRVGSAWTFAVGGGTTVLAAVLLGSAGSLARED